MYSGKFSKAYQFLSCKKIKIRILLPSPLDEANKKVTAVFVSIANITDQGCVHHGKQWYVGPNHHSATTQMKRPPLQTL